MEEQKDPLEKIIQNIIDNYDKDTEEAKTKEIIKKADASSLEELANVVLNKVNSNDDVAKQIYDLFYGELALGKDRSTSSKEALLRSLELKIESSKVLTELAKAIVKKEQNKNAGNVGVFVNTKEGDQFGIDIKNIQNELNDEA